MTSPSIKEWQCLAPLSATSNRDLLEKVMNVWLPDLEQQLGQEKWQPTLSNHPRLIHTYHL